MIAEANELYAEIGEIESTMAEKRRTLGQELLAERNRGNAEAFERFVEQLPFDMAEAKAYTDEVPIY